MELIGGAPAVDKIIYESQQLSFDGGVRWYEYYRQQINKEHIIISYLIINQPIKPDSGAGFYSYLGQYC